MEKKRTNKRTETVGQKIRTLDCRSLTPLTLSHPENKNFIMRRIKTYVLHFVQYQNTYFKLFCLLLSFRKNLQILKCMEWYISYRNTYRIIEL